MISSMYIKDVFHEYRIVNNKIVYLVRDGGVKVWSMTSNELEWEFSSKKAGNLACDENFILAQEMDGGISILDIESGTLLSKMENLRLLSERITNGEVLIEDQLHTFLYSVAEKKNKWVSDFKMTRVRMLFHEDVLYFNKYLTDYVIASVDFVNGIGLWQTDLSQSLRAFDDGPLMIAKVICVCNGLLIVSATYSVKANYVLALDSKTGRIVWKTERILNSAYHIRNIPLTSIALSIHGYGLINKNTEYAEIDMLSGKEIRSGIIMDLLEHKLVVKEWVLYDKRIFFTGAKNERGPTHIGIMEYPSFNLIWWKKVEMNKGCFFAAGTLPKVDNQRIYILDTGGTLHIIPIEN